MNTLFKTLLLSSLVGLSAPVFAHDNHVHEAAGVAQHEAISIKGAYARATAKTAAVGGAYLTITNTGAQDDRLVSVSSPVAKMSQIHETKENDGVMQMRELESGLALLAGETVELKPGGAHLMLMGLNQQLIDGEAVEVTLIFEKAGEVRVPFAIRTVTGKTASDQPCPHGEAAAHDHSAHSDDAGNAHKH